MLPALVGIGRVAHDARRTARVDTEVCIPVGCSEWGAAGCADAATPIRNGAIADAGAIEPDDDADIGIALSRCRVAFAEAPGLR